MSLPSQLTRAKLLFFSQKAVGHRDRRSPLTPRLSAADGEKPEQQAAGGFLQREGVKFSHQPLRSAAAV